MVYRGASWYTEFQTEEQQGRYGVDQLQHCLGNDLHRILVATSRWFVVFKAMGRRWVDRSDRWYQSHRILAIPSGPHCSLLHPPCGLHTLEVYIPDIPVFTIEPCRSPRCRKPIASRTFCDICIGRFYWHIYWYALRNIQSRVSFLVHAKAGRVLLVLFRS